MLDKNTDERKFSMRHLISVLILTASTITIFAQAPTSPPSNAAQSPNGMVIGWQFGSTVHVYIDGNMFPLGSAASQAVIQGFENNSLAYYYSREISYSYETVFTQPTLSNDQAYVTVGYFSNPQKYGENNFTYVLDKGTGLNRTITSTIFLAPSIAANPNGLTYTVSHEESHNNYLGDCPLCDGSSSIMTYQNDNENPPFEGPTINDIGAENDYTDIGGFGGTGGNGGCTDGSICANPNFLPRLD